MRVEMSAWIEVGMGTPYQIKEALNAANLPPNAILTEISMFNYTDFLESVMIEQHTRLKFEWSEER